LSLNGRTEIQTKLKADSNVTAIVGTYLTQPAIYSVPLTAYDGDSITMYQSAPKNGGLELDTDSNTVNCWSKKYDTAEALQEAVYVSLNRNSEGGDTFFKCSKVQVIPSPEIDGYYNAPVEVLVRKR